MQAMIDELAKQAAESLGQVSSKETLASFWQEYLSKNGKIPALMKNLRTVAPQRFYVRLISVDQFCFRVCFC